MIDGVLTSMQAPSSEVSKKVILEIECRTSVPGN